MVHRFGEIIPASGIYRVHHSEHRVPHEVTLFADEQFPRCSRCDNAVMFEPLYLAEKWTAGNRIVLHQLPVLDNEQSEAAANSQ